MNLFSLQQDLHKRMSDALAYKHVLVEKLNVDISMGKIAGYPIQIDVEILSDYGWISFQPFAFLIPPIQQRDVDFVYSQIPVLAERVVNKLQELDETAV
jgi:hypothetical protein